MDEAEYCNRIALINRGMLVALGSPRELKRRALHGNLLLVDCEDPGALLIALEKEPHVRDVAPFGSSLHLLVNNAAHDLPVIEAYLADRHLHWSNVKPIAPSLEDVFVQLVTATEPKVPSA
jgi:ABC-2 type transport system ATP-binding protein